MTTPSDFDRDAIRAEFERERGYWRPWTETLLQERPSFLLSYARYAGHPARTGPLSARMVELIYVGLDASSSHLFESGLRVHMQKALETGASRQDVFDVLHLVAAQGLECAVQGAAILAEETADPHAVGRTSAWDWLAEQDPGYVEVSRNFVDDPASLQGLTTAERSLIQIALNACFTAFNPQSLRHHIRQGLALGLDTDQMLQAIQLGAHLSVHGTALGAQVYASLT